MILAAEAYCKPVRYLFTLLIYVLYSIFMRVLLPSNQSRCSRGKNVFFYIQLDKVWARIWRIDKKPGSGSRIEKKLDPETHTTASNSTVLWRTYIQQYTLGGEEGGRGSMTYLPSRTSGAIQPSVPAIPDLWEKDIRPSWGGRGQTSSSTTVHHDWLESYNSCELTLELWVCDSYRSR